MKKKNIVLLVLLALLVVWVAFEMRPREGVDKMKDQPLLFEALDADGAVRIEIKKGEETELLEKQGGVWTDAIHDGYPADPDGVENALKLVREMKLLDVASKSLEKKGLFDLDEEKGIEVKFFGTSSPGGAEGGTGGREALLGHFTIGKRGPTYQTSYLLMPEEDRILLVSGNLKPAFDKGQRTWRSRKITKFEKDEVAAVRFEDPEQGEILLEKDAATDQWRVREPEEAPFKGNLVDSTLRTLSSLTIHDFPDEVGKPLPEYGLEPPERQITIYLTEGREVRILFGKEVEEKKQLYVKTDDSDYVYLLAAGMLRTLFRSLDVLKEAPPAEPPAEGIPSF